MLRRQPKRFTRDPPADCSRGLGLFAALRSLSPPLCSSLLCSSLCSFFFFFSSFSSSSSPNVFLAALCSGQTEAQRPRVRGQGCGCLLPAGCWLLTPRLDSGATRGRGGAGEGRGRQDKAGQGKARQGSQRRERCDRWLGEVGPAARSRRSRR